ncbi:MAG: EAL domain-containing protein [Rhizobiaceae bacterium]|nr:EAL domain-containing protein [Rhizobiaceae bacterium]
MIAARDIISLVNVDEVGIHTARIGPFVLKTTFLPVYRAGGGQLRISALLGGARFLLGGEAVGPSAMEQVPPEHRRQALELGRVLVALNRGNTGFDDVPVIMPAGESGETVADALDAILDANAEQLAGSPFEPARLICELPTADQVGLERLARSAAECRRRDIGVALRGFAGSQASIEAVRAIRPEIVAIDPRWFRHVAGMAQAARLLPGLFTSMRAAGAEVHVGGIDNPALKAAAIAAGADLLSGTSLAVPQLSGSMIEPEAIRLERATSSAKVVPLFA